MKSEEMAKRAIAALHNSEFMGSRITVEVNNLQCVKYLQTFILMCSVYLAIVILRNNFFCCSFQPSTGKKGAGGGGGGRGGRSPGGGRGGGPVGRNGGFGAGRPSPYDRPRGLGDRYGPPGGLPPSNGGGNYLDFGPTTFMYLFCKSSHRLL